MRGALGILWELMTCAGAATASPGKCGGELSAIQGVDYSENCVRGRSWLWLSFIAEKGRWAMSLDSSVCAGRGPSVDSRCSDARSLDVFVSHVHRLTHSYTASSLLTSSSR